MLMETPPTTVDLWSEWLLHRRHADDFDLGERVQAVVDDYADRVLNGARLQPGMTLVDVGSGGGLVAFRAIERVGPALQVVLTDISEPLLQHARMVASLRNVADQCRFVECRADDLGAIPDNSVDAVTTRSVLAYVSDKPAALREIFRVLKPGGRISIGEPVLQDEALFVRALRTRIDNPTTGPADKFLELLHRWKSAQFPDTEAKFNQSPLVNYNERTLFKFVLDTGFISAHMELHFDVMPALVTSWDTFIGSSPHPWAASLRTLLAEQFTQDEREFFEKIVRPGVESADSTNIDRMVFITGQKPAIVSR